MAGCGEFDFLWWRTFRKFSDVPLPTAVDPHCAPLVLLVFSCCGYKASRQSLITAHCMPSLPWVGRNVTPGTLGVPQEGYPGRSRQDLGGMPLGGRDPIRCPTVTLYPCHGCILPWHGFANPPCLLAPRALSIPGPLPCSQASLPQTTTSTPTSTTPMSPVPWLLMPLAVFPLRGVGKGCP